MFARFQELRAGDGVPEHWRYFRHERAQVDEAREVAVYHLRHRRRRTGQRRKHGKAQRHNYHPGEPPDTRTQRHAAQRGYDLSDLRARQITDADFARYDLILAMDWDNLALAQDLCPPAYAHKLRRMTEFCLQFDSPVVPDPYYGGSQGFEEVLDLVEDACEGLLRHVQRQLQAQVPPVQH